MIALAAAVMLCALQGAGQGSAQSAVRGTPRQAPGASGVRMSVSVEPETVHVGQPALLSVHVQAPAGTRLTFPPAVDSTASVEPLDPVAVDQKTHDGFVDAVASYRFLSWDFGVVSIPLATIRVERDGKVQELTVGDPRVMVESVLPADTALRKPLPARDIMLFTPFRWAWWVLVLAGFTVAAAGGWWMQQRARRVPPPVEPFAEAQRSLGRLAALDLIGVGEPAKHVGAAADILREFLAARDPGATLGLTTAELEAQLQRRGLTVSARVGALLGAADAIKFAGTPVDARTAESLGAEAANLVLAVHQADVSGKAS